jgi:hypothetical protein
LSKCTIETFAALSGITRATRRGRTAIRSKTPVSARTTGPRSAMFAAVRLGTTAPPGSVSKAYAPIRAAPPCRVIAIAPTLRGAISTATVGAAVESRDGLVIRRMSPC